MKEFTSCESGGLLWNRCHEKILIVPWGLNGVRVRVTQEAALADLPQALLEPAPEAPEASVEIGEKTATLVHGKITVQITPQGQLLFIRSSDSAVLLKECVQTTSEYPGRHFQPRGGHWHIEQRFFARDDEKFYGLGQHQHGYLDQKGCVIDLYHRNMEVSIPFLVSNLGYGFLWNYPGVGRVELGRNETRWVADAGRQIDYYVVVEDAPADIMERYADVTGHPTAFPEWAAGFWQCKLRYKTQEELLSIAREYHRRKLPLSVIVIDFFHWTKMGDWKFDQQAWPDPAGMVRELKEMGVECMVSVWPTVSAMSENYGHMEAHGLLVRNEHGLAAQSTAKDDDNCRFSTFYDAMNPEARAFLWEKIRANYCRHGIRLFWLDTSEPELSPLEHDNARYYLGNGLQVGGLYPMFHSQAFYEGLKAEGEAAPLVLSRSAWAGSQRFGTAVWSADIPSTFDSLRRQVTGGLNIAMSGIPWWTTDIGGFYGGDIEDPDFHELLIRWFQYGVFCPVFRLHGVRRHASKHYHGTVADPEHPNVPNEVWSYGEEVCERLTEQLHLRERLRPYIMKQMRLAEEKGTPPMRPLFFDFADDPDAWAVEDAFLFGPDILVAPVVVKDQRSRKVYLPRGATWRDAWSSRTYEGGQEIEAAAPITHIPVFLREGGEARVDNLGLIK